MAGGAFHPQAFDPAAFSAKAFSSQDDAPGALSGAFASTFTATADLVLLVRPLAPVQPTHGARGSARQDARRRHFPARQPARTPAHKRARRRADEELLLAIL